jgi:nucleolar complex protein 3
MFKTIADIGASENHIVKKLALATQLSVYKDVIPGYRIRPLGEEESKIKVSKDIRKLRNFEQALVGGYQLYVKDLASFAKQAYGRNAKPDKDGMSAVAISCACALLVAVPHFNFRGELLKILIKKLSTRNVDESFNKCRETLEILFRDDEDGTPSLDAMTLITRMMKAKGYWVDESVLNTFLHLRLLSEFSSKGSQNRIDRKEGDGRVRGKKTMKDKKEFRTKKQHKQDKENREIEKEMKEADAEVDHEERDRMQADTLKMVFVTYFRVLKSRNPELMGAVLEGLAKYAHLINQDFFGDLLEALKELVGNTESDEIPDEEEGEEKTSEEYIADERAQRNASREALLCTVTAFALLQGQDTAGVAGLSLDLNFFVSHLYRTLYPLALNADIELSAKSLHIQDPNTPSLHNNMSSANKINISTTTVLLLRSLTAVLLPANVRTVPPLRAAAFSKQLLTSALHLPEKSAQATLGLMNQIGKAHGKKISGLWNTEERRGNGVFNGAEPDVDISNPFATTVWEGEILRRHFCPGVRDGMKALDRIIGAANR